MKIYENIRLAVYQSEAKKHHIKAVYSAMRKHYKELNHDLILKANDVLDTVLDRYYSDIWHIANIGSLSYLFKYRTDFIIDILKRYSVFDIADSLTDLKYIDIDKFYAAESAVSKYESTGMEDILKVTLFDMEDITDDININSIEDLEMQIRDYFYNFYVEEVCPNCPCYKTAEEDEYEFCEDCDFYVSQRISPYYHDPEDNIKVFEKYFDCLFGFYKGKAYKFDYKPVF